MNLPTCLQTYTPNKLFETFSDVTTIEQALAAKAPSLIRLSKTDGCTKKQVFGLMQLHLILISYNSKVQKGLSKIEIDMLATDIMRDFFYLTFADINIIFKRFYHGQYKELYGKLTVSEVYKWFEDYATERCNIAEEQSRIEDEKLFETEFSVPKDLTLENIGYVKDKATGAWRVDAEQLAKREPKRIEEEQRKRSETSSLELERQKFESIYKNIVAKPARERSQSEIDFAEAYEHEVLYIDKMRRIMGKTPPAAPKP